jgi:ABC-type transport system involved in multi-copper enzyme maturation permease subunit
VSGVVVAETLRRHFTHLAYVVALLALIGIVAAITAFGSAPDAGFGFLSLFAIIAGCQLIGPEFSSGTLQLILSKPIQRSAYLLSRVAGVVLALWFAVAAVLAGELIGRVSAGGPIGWRPLLAAATATALEVLLTCSLLAFFGSFSRSYLNVAVYIGGNILLGMILGLFGIMRNATHGEAAAIGAFLRAHPAIGHALERFKENLFPSAPRVAFDRNWMLMVVSNALIALLLACLVFRRREVPYGAD